MIRWNCFPRWQEIPEHMQELVTVFETAEEEISSASHSLESNAVLKLVSGGLLQLGYAVEQGKKKDELIHVPVLYGENGKNVLSFDADAYSRELRTVVEVEAGRAVDNYQFLKDFYQACMMQNVDHLCIAVRKNYRNTNDFAKVSAFFETLYSSNRMQIPLKTILIVGY